MKAKFIVNNCAQLMVFSLKVSNILTLFLKLNLHVIFVIFFFYYFSPLDYTIARRGDWL